jgi:predicted dinucleotide-binding enzyme
MLVLEATTNFVFSRSHQMAHVAIIGTGNMGQAIAAVAGKGGNTVQLLGQDDIDTPVGGDIVVLAVPYPAVSTVLDQRGSQPTSRVLKAFNTTFAATLAGGSVGPLTTTVPIAGDDADADATLAGVVTAGSFGIVA